jgi:hypothetical protein
MHQAGTPQPPHLFDRQEVTHDRRNFQSFDGAGAARARRRDADPHVLGTARLLGLLDRIRGSPQRDAAAIAQHHGGKMIKGLLEFFLMRRFPKLTLFGLAVAALIGMMRAKRAP